MFDFATYEWRIKDSSHYPRLWLTKEGNIILLFFPKGPKAMGRWRIQHLAPTFTVYNGLLAPNDRHKREISNVMEKEGTEEVKGSERERCGTVGWNQVGEGVIRELKRTERQKEARRHNARGKTKSTERFQRHVGALWAHTIVRSCILFSCSWKKNLNWCEWLARARHTHAVSLPTIEDWYDLEGHTGDRTR